MIVGLDTNVMVAALRGREPHYRQRMGVARDEGHQLAVSSIVVYELVRGAMRSARPERHLSEIDALLGEVEVSSFSGDDALQAARVQVDLERQGLGIGVFDRLIAGQALQRDWTLVTANVREFARVPGLRVIDWSDPAGPIDLTGATARLRRPSED